MTRSNDNMKSAETGLNAELSAEPSMEQRDRMRSLIAELVKSNQELRFRVARLNEKLERLEKGLPDEIPWAGMLI